MAVLTVQFKVGVPRTEALVRLYDTLNANQTGCRAAWARQPPIVKPKGIDDVPVVTSTLHSPMTQTAAPSLWSAWPAASRPN